MEEGRHSLAAVTCTTCSSPCLTGRRTAVGTGNPRGPVEALSKLPFTEGSEEAERQEGRKNPPTQVCTLACQKTY